MGFDPEALDAADLAQSFGGEDGLLPDGYGALVARLAEGLPVRLGVPVTAIEERADRVELTTPEGRIEAGHVVVTASTTAIAGGAIRFTPALPEPVEGALADLPLGNLVKITLRLEDTALPHPAGCFLMPDEPSLATPLLHLRPAGRPIVTAFVGGRAGDAVDGLDEREAVALASEQLAALCGADARRAVRGGTVSRWRAIPWIAGSYTGARPGRLAARAVLRAPWSARVHYAGEATAPPGWQATVAGAWLAGRATAQRIAAGC
jgi:monoamine oxidase